MQKSEGPGPGPEKKQIHKSAGDGVGDGDAGNTCRVSRSFTSFSSTLYD